MVQYILVLEHSLYQEIQKVKHARKSHENAGQREKDKTLNTSTKQESISPSPKLERYRKTASSSLLGVS